MTLTPTPNATEVVTPTPTETPNIDTDTDGVLDHLDNCPFVQDPDQLNTDDTIIDNGPVVPGDDTTVPNGDALGDACDDDDDNDGMLDSGINPLLGLNGEDVGCGSGPTNPLRADSDGDLVIDSAECLLGSDPLDPASKPVAAPADDSDHDGIPAAIEALFGSSDNTSDSDGDKVNDGIEVRGWGTSPTSTDSDGDGCDDGAEIADVNGDGKVSVADVLLIARRAAQLSDDDIDPDPPWNVNPAFDVTKDGKITVADMLLVAMERGKSCY